ncbi:hypothetical protein P168DRAFT_322166 [Aspergillus terreus]|uniref:Uncharacterized protein n=1 Tax=Aspergillus terreus TaxID=33178 RepID=A0A5M3ZCV4_ASPTE|nr:hypothetical protein ATETN484_0012003700 [Aspergillus terreus]GFF19264.1 hypothetical protein P168DRAFT_322166 [Aspergillus terreus]
MGICSAQPNCTVPSSYLVPFTADPDIAGKGVLAAFLIGVWSTFALILWSYFFHSIISDDQISDFDRWIRHQSLTLRNHIKRWFINEESENRSRPSTAHIKVCLMLSDQQLVMGTAMLLIGLARHCNIPQYYFEIIVDFGWVTSSVFQGSVLVTYPIFQQNPAMRHWRAAWMTFQAGFIFICDILTHHQDWMLTFGMPTQCIWDSFSTWYGDGLGTILLIGELSLQILISSLLGLILTFAVLLWGFRYIFESRQSQSRVQAMQGSEDGWSTGQILPLLMLALPLFTAVELYWDEDAEHRNPEDPINAGVRKRERSAIEGLICSTHSVISSPATRLLPAPYTPRIISAWNLGAREVFESCCHSTTSVSSEAVDPEPCLPAFLRSQEAVLELQYLTIEKLWFRILLVVMNLALLGEVIFVASVGYVF